MGAEPAWWTRGAAAGTPWASPGLPPGRTVGCQPRTIALFRERTELWSRGLHLFGKAGKERVRFELFASAPFRGKDLLFHDATRHFQTTAEEAQISRILGLEYVALLSLTNSLVRWCCIGDAELRKCEEWALHIRSDPLVCVHADSKTNCIELIKNNGADAVTLDATHAYFADKCGLRPVAAECYGELASCFWNAALPPGYAIALVKKAAKHLSIRNLQGRRSCHSHVYSPAGWLLPSRYTQGSRICSADRTVPEYFWKGCMPGAGGNLCKVCIGPAEREGEKPSSRCAAHHDERYYGNLGALRSFGDVAFLEHHNLLQNIDSGWATGYSAGDLELLCPDGSRAAVTDWQTCNLGPVPPSVVVARPMTVARVYDFLAKSQVKLEVPV
uniref:Transferrin-like domain-containing protein n=1 Tax=Varanus komodoensis TaxID=61221 RepID=A0A8D2Q0I0_VARKO